jgi:DNA-binding protein Fis
LVNNIQTIVSALKFHHSNTMSDHFTEFNYCDSSNNIEYCESDDQDKEKLDNSMQEQNPQKNNILILWDFDWSLINENSDSYLYTYYFNEKGESLYNNLKIQAASSGVTCFTDFMDGYAWKHLFDNCKLTPTTFREALSTIPIYEENIHVVKTLSEYHIDKDHDQSCNVYQMIVSNANTELIDIILKQCKLHSFFAPDNIYTNPGYFDDNTG